MRPRRPGPGMQPVIEARARISGRTEAQEWARREQEAFERLAAAVEINLARNAADPAAVKETLLLPCAEHPAEDCPGGVIGCCAERVTVGAR